MAVYKRETSISGILCFPLFGAEKLWVKQFPATKKTIPATGVIPVRDRFDWLHAGISAVYR